MTILQLLNFLDDYKLIYSYVIRRSLIMFYLDNNKYTYKNGICTNTTTSEEVDIKELITEYKKNNPLK